MKMEGGSDPTEKLDRAREIEAKLRQTAEMKGQVETAFDRLGPEQHQAMQERIAEVEAELTTELKGLYGQVKNIDPALYSRARFDVAIGAIDNKLAEQQKEGRDRVGIEESCKKAFEKVRTIILGAGLTVAVISEAMMFETAPSLSTYGSVDYLAAQAESAEWAITAVESGYAAVAAIIAAYLIKTAAQALKERSATNEIGRAKKNALEERGMAA